MDNADTLSRDAKQIWSDIIAQYRAMHTARYAGDYATAAAHNAAAEVLHDEIDALSA